MKRIELRDATSEDWPIIQLLHVEHQNKQGTNYELPALFLGNKRNPQIPICLVAVDENDHIEQCVYVESVAELRFVGCHNPKATAFSRREADGLSYILKLMGFRFLECYVPRQLKKAISKPLKRAGFEDKDQELSYFSRDLR